MENPVIACDVSRGLSHIQGFDGLTNPFGEVFVVRHVKSEMRKIKELAKSLELKTRKKPVFVFEFTGIYHQCIANYAKQIGLQLYAISPLESAKVRKSAIRPTKTDSKDCLNIATVYYSRKVREYIPDENGFKSLSREKNSLRIKLTREKCKYHRYIDLIWPCFDETIGLDTQCAKATIRLYKHPYVIKKRTVPMIASVLINNCSISKNRALEIAQKIKDYSTNCVSGAQENSCYVNSLVDTLNCIDELNAKMEKIDFELEKELKQKYPNYFLLKSIPGFGKNIALLISAELGDFSRFKSAKQLIAYIGLDPSILQSGTNDGEHYSITRKGNSIIRSQLYLAVNQMLTQKLDNQITRFYFNKKSSGLSHKVAAVASCRKLVCCIFGMLSNGTCFETK